MQCVILAAGLGTRMGELTKDKPKPLLKLEMKDVSPLEHNLHNLPEEIDEVIIVVGYLKEQIQQAIGDQHAGKKIIYVDQTELKGTAHALTQCEDILHDRFLVIMGDDLYNREDLTQLIKEPLAILVWGLEEDSPNDHSAILKMDDQGRLVDIIERQPAERGVLINAGAYVLDQRYFDYPMVPAGNRSEEYGLPQTFLQMAKAGEKIQIVKATQWYKVTVPEDLER